MKRRRRSARLLADTRVYLSGPMDFVASRADEEKFGWRNRVGDLLRRLGVTVFDPWHKPEVRGFFEYGVENEQTTDARKAWTFAPGARGARARSEVAGGFWPQLHVDLRLVDTSDFVIAHCPTNIYSVGTPHEIVVARQQRKPVLFVSPPFAFPALGALRRHLAHDAEGTALLEKLASEVPIKENPTGAPSLWYMPLVGSESFFDGFGFAPYRRRFGWRRIPMDDAEDARTIRKPLLPFLERIHRGELPRKWDHRRRRFVASDDWLLWDMRPARGRGTRTAAG
jgi:hypothetical protein